MTLLTEFKRRSRSLFQPLLALALLGYFGYHAIQGDRGILALHALQQDIAEASSERAMLAAQRAALEERVALLRPESLDPDMLDERARRLLNVAGGRDVLLAPGRAPRYSVHQVAER